MENWSVGRFIVPPQALALFALLQYSNTPLLRYQVMRGLICLKNRTYQIRFSNLIWITAPPFRPNFSGNPIEPLANGSKWVEDLYPFWGGALYRQRVAMFPQLQIHGNFFFPALVVPGQSRLAQGPDSFQVFFAAPRGQQADTHSSQKQVAQMAHPLVSGDERQLGPQRVGGGNLL